MKKRCVRKSNKIMKVLAVLAVSAIMVFVGVISGINKKNYTYSETTTHYVESGDTLWTIAQNYCDERHDVRQVIQTIQKLNNLNADIYAGEIIVIPLYDVLQ